MSVYTTEIASDKIPSDNVIHQRLLSAYHQAKPYIKGNLLELGCGEGRGVELLAPLANSYIGIDKIKSVIDNLEQRFPDYKFLSGVFPPFPFEDNSFDTIITFQVIEHVKDDEGFIKEIHRVLKPRGRALITTPNIKMTLSRNPWHEREYTGDELTALCKKYFEKVEMKGIAGNEKVMEYHERNRLSVQRLMRFDIFDLQHRLPAGLLRMPYDILNRMNRNKLKKTGDELVKSITVQDFNLRDQDEQNLDLFCLVTK
ncbi:class I SAM-dependent methyltransferase [Ekhidna sp.]|jgi:ubiquinone/menaquinone biosynthesis C-methylase UbiE|uniref:class I SAM-dependent methyltransferase n=1 Tax=Ekhidna sp. TaxID=2608089 RepID=UPI0032EE157E